LKLVEVRESRIAAERQTEALRIKEECRRGLILQAEIMSLTVVNLAEWRDDHQPAPIEVELPSGSIWNDFAASLILVTEADGCDIRSFAETLRTIAAYVADADGTRRELVEEG
jgi:hypothetical protein